MEPPNVDDLKSEVIKLRDQARLKAHLFGMDAKTQYEKLTERLLGLERDIQAESNATVQAVTSRLSNFANVLREYVHDQTFGHLPEGAVRDVMSTPVHTCTADESLSAAAEQMWQQDCGCLVVVDADRRALGIITDRDICMAAFTQSCTLHQSRVWTAMSNAVETCSPDDDIAQVHKLMRTREVRRLPVVDAKQAVLGIISIGDLARHARGTQQAQMAKALVSDTLACVTTARVSR